MNRKKLVGIVSPPFEDSISSEGHGIDMTKTNMWSDKSQLKIPIKYGQSRGQIGSLKSEQKDKADFDITQLHSCDDSLYWTGCYSSDSSFKKFITPESFAHPAKMSMLLCDRIFKHLKKLGLLKKGDVIADFMAGTGRTNIVASLHGFDSIAVELEPHFIRMIEDNKRQMEKTIGRKQNWEIIQGDSRRLAELLQIRHNTVGIVSPPYFQKGSRPNPEDKTINTKNRVYARNLYGNSEEQIANLPDNNLVGITSPPYDIQVPGSANIEKRLDFVGGKSSTARNTYFGEPKWYGKNPENLGNQQSESYLSAMFQVYQQASQLIPIIVTVTKNPTRSGRLRRLDTDTAKLLMSVGYRIVDYHRSLLFEEKKQMTLKGKIKKDLKGRISFFKRLSVQKGNVAARWEDVIVGVREDLNER